MGITAHEEQPNLIVLRIEGVLKKADLDAVQASSAEKWGSASDIKLLIILTNFKGWEKHEGWGDMSFYAEHGEKITKIAIVGDPKHQTDFLMFTGAGFRPGPVKYFPPDQIAQARQWLT